MLNAAIKKYLYESELALTEKRRNLEKNPKTTIDDFIKKVGGGSSTIFVRYSDTKEDTSVMSLNPNYQYSNVWGKYMYPYDYWYAKSVDSETGKYVGRNNDLPFAGHMQYVNFYNIRMGDGIIDSQSPPSRKWTFDKLSEMIAIYPDKEFSKYMREAIEEGDDDMILKLYSYYSHYTNVSINDTHFSL